jgi:hypothetical protein
MFNFFKPKQAPSPKTVDEIVTQFAQTISDLNKAAEVASADVVNAEEAIRTWEQHKAYAQNELDRAKSIASKFESLLS